MHLYIASFWLNLTNKSSYFVFLASPNQRTSHKICRLSCIALSFFSDIPTAAFQFDFICEKVKMPKKEQLKQKNK